jgi:hypothetical protein
MKYSMSLLICTLIGLPGCKTKEKKDEEKTVTQPATQPKPLFRFTEKPTDTTLPTKTKNRNSDLEIVKESTSPEIVE